MEATHDPPESGRYDVAFVDLRRAAPDLRSVRSALAAVNEMGLVVIAGVDAEQHGDRLRQGLSGTIVDRYVEVDTMTRDSSGSTCWLLGRPLVT